MTAEHRAAEDVDPATRPTAPRLRSALELTSLAVPPVSLITALAYYFGWRFTNARALYFGLDPSILGFSSQDYILRAVDPLFLPMSILFLILLVLTSLHSGLASWLERNPHRAVAPIISLLLAVLGSGFVVAGSTSLALSDAPHPIAPLLLAGGTGVVFYAVDMYGRRGGRTGTALSGAHTIRLVLLFCIMSAALFWSVGDWADAVGRGRARGLAEQLSFRPAAIVFSKQSLHFGSEEVAVTEFPDAESAYRFQYTGLRLLLYSAGKYFFLSEGWTPETGHAVVVKDDDLIRVEFRTS